MKKGILGSPILPVGVEINDLSECKRKNVRHVQWMSMRIVGNAQFVVMSLPGIALL